MENDTFVMHAPIGPLEIKVLGSALTGIEFLPSRTENASPRNLFSHELQKYFADPHHKFKLLRKVQGSDFQHRVWDALLSIPVGETRTYGELAKVLNSSPRAVGNACRCNPVPIVVPCHRVVSAQGLGGFSGDTNGGKTVIKKWLLAHEGVSI